MKRRVGILLVVLALAVGGGTAFFLLRNGGETAADVLRVSGNIEVTDAEVSFKVPGRVVQRYVDEGELVDAGAEIAVLESADLEAELALRQAELAAARAALAELEAGSRPEEIESAQAAMIKADEAVADLEAGSRPQEIAIAQAELAAAKLEQDRARREFERAQELIVERSISQEDYDRIETAWKVAQENVTKAAKQLDLTVEGPRYHQVEQARAASWQAAARFMLAIEGPREEKIEQARAQVEQATKAVELAKVKRGYTKVVSPLAGVVLSKNIEPGEYVAPGTPVVTVGDLVHVWLRAYINETDLGRVKVGQNVRVTTDTYPNKTYEGRLSFIASEAEFTPKNVQTQEQRVKLVYRIKIDIHNPDMELKPGMPADAEIVLGGQ